jgi:rubredoxin
MTQQTVQINFTGGIVSPGYLKTILEVAAAAKVTHTRFGLRQQLILDIPVKHFGSFEAECQNRNIIFYKKKNVLPNIVSSYPAAGIFTTDTWLREGVYKDIFNLFDYTPTLKINICDSTQTLVPLFTGHINWISATAQHFWHVYFRFPKTQILYCIPELIYTNDIAAVSKELEQLLLQSTTTSGITIFKRLKQVISYISKPTEKEVTTPPFSLPYYEGFNKYDAHYWLGIYRRNETFPLSFLLDVCAVCAQTKIGQLYTTPWKSLIIKGIEATHRSLWDYVLGKYRINVRHAANELAWQLEDNDEEGLQLKRQIIRYFDKEDVRTYGLCFAVQTHPYSGMFGSVLIKKQVVKNLDKLKALERFEIRYSQSFNPNTFTFVSFRQNVAKEHLGIYLVALCKLFYEQQSHQHTALSKALTGIDAAPELPMARIIHQCKHCLTTYYATLGDPENGIAVTTPFEDLPDNYCCPLCDAGKEAFIAIDETRLQLQHF